VQNGRTLALPKNARIQTRKIKRLQSRKCRKPLENGSGVITQVIKAASCMILQKKMYAGLNTKIGKM
jgi:hypothetical protein